MKRTIDIKTMTTYGVVPAAGFYDMAGSLYVAIGANVMPMCLGLIQNYTEDASEAPGGSGISEGTLLKALAIALLPSTAAQVISTQAK